MPTINLPPFITDVRDCPHLLSHPREFFSVLDDLKPYVLTEILANCLRIKLTSDVIDLKKLRANMEHLNNLGYWCDTAIYTRSYRWTTFIGLDDLSISWSNNKDNYVRNIRIYGGRP